MLFPYSWYQVSKALPILFQETFHEKSDSKLPIHLPEFFYLLDTGLVIFPDTQECLFKLPNAQFQKAT